jgi:hypothetical protein
MESSREVRILKDLRGTIEGRDVLVVEDIVDTGHTLHHVMNLLRSREPARLKSIALLDKPERREIDMKADWTGFEIPDEFVVGYGIDFAQQVIQILQDHPSLISRISCHDLSPIEIDRQDLGGMCKHTVFDDSTLRSSCLGGRIQIGHLGRSRSG